MVDTAVQSLLPRIRPYVRACPLAVVQQQARKMAHQFFVQTEVWRETVTLAQQTLLAAYINEYVPTLDDDYSAVVKRLVTVYIDGTSFDQAGYAFRADGVLVFDTARTDTTEAVTADIVIQPEESFEDYPSYLMSRWGDGIVAGTIGRLKAQLGVPWSSPQEAQSYLDEFENAIGRARTENMGGRLNGQTTIQMIDFI